MRSTRTAVFMVLMICIGCIISWIALSALSSPQSYTASSSSNGGAALDSSAHIPFVLLYDNADAAATIRSTRNDQSARLLEPFNNSFMFNVHHQLQLQLHPE